MQPGNLLTFPSDNIYFVLETEHFKVISRKLEVVHIFFQFLAEVFNKYLLILTFMQKCFYMLL